jgi:hypothetical protein
MSDDESKDSLRPQTWGQQHGLTLILVTMVALFALVIIAQMFD